MTLSITVRARGQGRQLLRNLGKIRIFQAATENFWSSIFSCNKNKVTLQDKVFKCRKTIKISGEDLFFRITTFLGQKLKN